MRRAIDLARRGWGQVAPNPLVGAVVVRDGVVVGEGYHARFGTAHAEPVALGAAADRARGSTVYVTLEPCAHLGKTPPCVDALIAAGVARVVAAVPDPNPTASGGAARLAAAGVLVEFGVLAEDARELNAAFFNAFESERAWITLKLALSLDGAIAPAAGLQRWMTSEESRAAVHQLRAGADGIAAGIGTVLVDDPELRVRAAAAPRLAPVRIVFDRHARLPTTSVLVRTARETPTLVVASAPDAGRAAALRAEGVDVVTAATLVDAMKLIRARGVRSLLVEGGATLASALVSERLVDRLVIFHAPVLLGARAVASFGALPAAAATAAGRLALLRSEPSGDDVMSTYALRFR